MKFQILNNEELGFFNGVGNKTAIIKMSGSDMIFNPISSGDIIMGDGNTINDIEIGIDSISSNMTFLGGGTISSNGGTLFIGDSSNNDNIILTGVTISSSVSFASGITGSFQGSFSGDGSNITGITATIAPGGDSKTIQFNDNNTATEGNNNFTFDKTTNTAELTGSLNVSGSSSADYFFGDGSGLTNIVGAFPFTGSAGVSGSIIVEGSITASEFSGDGSGLTNISGVFPFTGSAGISGSLDVDGRVTATEFYGNGVNLTGVTSTFAPTGQDKSLQFNKGGIEISGSDGILFDYNTDSLYVAQAITASEFTGHGSLNDPFTGSVDILGNTNISGNLDIVGSLDVDGDITGSGELTLNSGIINIPQGGSVSIGNIGSLGSYRLVAIGQVNNLNAGNRVAIGPRGVGGGIGSVAIGDETAGNNTSTSIIAIGQNANRFSSGNGSIAIGSTAMYNDSNTLGNAYSIAIGSGAGNTIGGEYNILMGESSGRVVRGDHNIVIGTKTGYYASGSKNILLGYQAGYNLTGSNQLIIANNSSSALITGDFDTGAVEFLGNSFKVGTSRAAGPVFEVGDGPISSYTTDLILRPRANSAYNFHYWGIIRWDPSGTNRGLRLLSGDYINSVQIGTGLSGSSTENIIANFTNSGVRIGDRSTPNADLDVNGTAIVSGSLITSGGLVTLNSDVFTPNDSNNVTNRRVITRGGIYVGGDNNNFGINYEGNRIYANIGHGSSNPTWTPNNSAWVSNTSLNVAGTVRATNFYTVGASGTISPTGGTDLGISIAGSQTALSSNQSSITLFGENNSSTTYGRPSKGAINMLVGQPSGSVLIRSSNNTTPNVEIDVQGGTTNGGTHHIGFAHATNNRSLATAIISKATGASGRGLLGLAVNAGGDSSRVTWDDRVLEIQNNQAIFKQTVNAENDLFTIGGSNTGDVGLFFHKETRTAIVSNLLGGSNASDIRLVTGIPKNAGMVSASADQYARLTITQDGNTEISGTLSIPGFPDISASLASAGSGGAAFPHTGSAIISGSLIIDGGPLDSSVFEVNGTQGQLFSIIDSLSGSLFAVSDVSGLPILEVFSDDTIKMGSFNNEALEISGSDVNFNNLPTSDPGVSGTLFQTGSDAIGATAGFQVICISQG